MAILDKAGYNTDRIFKYTDVKIASGQTESEAIDCLGGVLVGIKTPATLTGTSMTFKVSDDGVAYIDYYNAAGNQVTSAMPVSKRIGIEPVDFAGIQKLKIVSSSAEGADRLFTLFLRGM
jgi:hypothetical protein